MERRNRRPTGIGVDADPCERGRLTQSTTGNLVSSSQCRAEIAECLERLRLVLNCRSEPSILTGVSTRTTEHSTEDVTCFSVCGPRFDQGPE